MRSYSMRKNFGDTSFCAAPRTSVLSSVNNLRQTFKSELPSRDYLNSCPVPTTPLRSCKLRWTTGRRRLLTVWSAGSPSPRLRALPFFRGRSTLEVDELSLPNYGARSGPRLVSLVHPNEVPKSRTLQSRRLGHRRSYGKKKSARERTARDFCDVDGRKLRNHFLGKW